MSSLRECPNCCAKAGYRYFLRVEMEGSWGEEAESTGAVLPPLTVECVVCRHRMMRKRAEGK